ncbi:iron-containing alcohol dehydrogenase [Novosphingobium sp.]|uniref:iron-containing alcohol dehydrogenase n=1 Tax=Novosphingobium sp. TaxID=1874826 RepID=UPI00286DF4D3|nr:iron-containing alcohol dehydrogenase [Novosphingobium sp.]
MGPALVLPRLVFGIGVLARLSDELALLGVERPLLIADRGLAAAGIVAQARAAADPFAAEFLDVPENPTAAGADAAARVYREAACDGIIALGGGSVIDTAKIVAALVVRGGAAAALIGRPECIARVAPLIAIPTTIGTGSESSPVAALHIEDGEAAIGTRGPLLVPRVALCDPALARTLPRRLIAATGIDALAHCVEGFFAEPAHPVIDALALDGAARVSADIHAALEPEGDAARASLMAAAFAGGAAIHKGLGPAHAVALVCGDQDIHHGTLIGIALPTTATLLARARPAKAARLRTAMGLPEGSDIGRAMTSLVASLGLPTTLCGAGYRLNEPDDAAAAMAASPFNRTSPYAPTCDEYRAIISAIIGS